MELTLQRERKTIFWIYGLSIFFVVLNMAFTAFEIYYFNLVPVFLLVILAAFLAMDKLLLVIVFLTPLSVPLKEFIPGLKMDLSLPTEPLLFGLLILFLLKIISERSFDKRVWKHPATIAILLNLGWIFVTSLTSSLPVVSLKFFLARLWFVCGFYLLATQVFRRAGNISNYLWAYIIPFAAIIVYAFIHHVHLGLLDQQASHSAVRPFYNDHTAYGAILAFFYPVLFAFALRHDKSIEFKTLIWILILVFSTAIVFSYTRATWISLAGAFLIFLIVRLRMRLSMIFLFACLILFGVYSYRTEIVMMLEQNKQTSSGDFAEHVQSISNITSDASNLERINRWHAALRMFKERPLVGWGPGTYQFQYAPYQYSWERTFISTNFGDRGNAHSEYIGPLAESGFPGTITILLILITSLTTGFKTYFRTEERWLKMITLAITLGLCTYFLHGFLNNFLETDKASAPFWGFIAVLVALDLRSRKRKQDKLKSKKFNTND